MAPVPIEATPTRSFSFVTYSAAQKHGAAYKRVALGWPIATRTVPPLPMPAQRSIGRSIALAAVTVVLALLAVYEAAALFSEPYGLLMHNDGHGYQIAGAAEILAGRHPFIDFKDVYGPLVYYASALAQALSGGLFGEFVLTCGALGLAYALLFRLILACEVRPLPAALATLVGIAVLPVPYRYYLTLCPLLFLWAAWWYTSQPGRRRAAVVALAVTTAGLFRPDIGVYTFVASVVLIAADSHGRRDRPARSVIEFTGWVLAWAAPWLLWVGMHGKLWAYLRNSSLDAMETAAEFTQSVPWFDWSTGFLSTQNAKAYLFRLPIALVLLAVIGLALRWRSLESKLRLRVLCALTFAGCFLLQISHRVDWMHVRDVIPPCLLLLAWVATPSHVGRRLKLLLGIVAGVVATSLVAASLLWEYAPPLSPGEIALKIHIYNRSRDDLRTYLNQYQRVDSVRLVQYIRSHSAPDEGIFVVLEGPQLNYFCDRPLVSGLLAIHAGYFTSPEHQRELIHRLETGRMAFIVVDETDLALRPSESLARMVPLFDRWLHAEYVPRCRIGRFLVLVPKSRAPNGGKEPTPEELQRFLTTESGTTR